MNFKTKIDWAVRRLLLLALCGVAGGLFGSEARSLSVGKFNAASTEFVWNGCRGKMANWLEVFSGQLVMSLRRDGLTVLSNASVRVVGRVAFDAKSSPTLTVNTEVNDVATGTVRWSDSTQIETQFFAVTNLAMFVAATSEAAAQTVADKIAVRMRPYRVLSREANGRLVLGDGFGVLRAGECLTVFSPSDHPTAIGTVQVLSVTPTSARAVLIEREVSEIPLGSTLWRIPLRTRGEDEDGGMRN